MDDPRVPATHVFSHSQQHLADALDGLDQSRVNPQILLRGLGDDYDIRMLDQLDVQGRSHVAQYLHRLGQIAQLLKSYGHLSEDALLGFARAYRFLAVSTSIPNVAVRDRTRDLAQLFNAWAENAGGKKLAEVLEEFAQSSASGVGKWQRMVVPKIHEIFPTLYRITDRTKDAWDNGMNHGNLLDFVKQNRRLPRSAISMDSSVQPVNMGHFVIPEAHSSPAATRAAAQIDTTWNYCDVRFHVRSASLDEQGHKCIVPNSAQQQTATLNEALEPLARDHPTDTSGITLAGGGRQFLIEGGEVYRIEVWDGAKWVDEPFIP